MKLCRHCNRHPINRPRGLCWGCWHQPGVKDKYPVSSKFTGRMVPAGHGYRLPDRPTPHMPKTAEKIEVLAERAAQGVALFHPRDARGE